MKCLPHRTKLFTLNKRKNGGLSSWHQYRLPSSVSFSRELEWKMFLTHSILALQEVEWRPWQKNIRFNLPIRSLHFDNGCHTLQAFQMSSLVYLYSSCILSMALDLFLNEDIFGGLLDTTSYEAATVAKCCYSTWGQLLFTDCFMTASKMLPRDTQTDILYKIIRGKNCPNLPECRIYGKLSLPSAL